MSLSNLSASAIAEELGERLKQAKRKSPNGNGSYEIYSRR